MGISFGCSASGERLVSAARDGDLQEAQALLECNPRLAKYSTFGVRNSPLHFAAMQGHNEIVTLLLEHGVEVDTRKYCGQTALMQACRHGHWEVVQTLILYKANVSKSDYLNGQTAVHFAAANGHARCIRLLVADYIPSVPNYWNGIKHSPEVSVEDSDSLTDCISLRRSLYKLINRSADGGVTALHMACLNGHTEAVHLLLDLGANASAVTFQYDTTVDMIGAGSTPLHYAACGGSIQCCQILLSRGANFTARNCNGWTPQLVAQVWGRHWLESILMPTSQESLPEFGPSPYLALPLMSVVKIARELGLGNLEVPVTGEFCAVCLERVCTVAAEGCGHTLCTRCALYLCGANNGTVGVEPAGSIPCPLCRQGVVSFVKLATVVAAKEWSKASIGLLCTTCSSSLSGVGVEACLPADLLLLRNNNSKNSRTATATVDNKRSRVSPLASSITTVTCLSTACGHNRKYDEDDSAFGGSGDLVAAVRRLALPGGGSGGGGAVISATDDEEEDEGDDDDEDDDEGDDDDDDGDGDGHADGENEVRVRRRRRMRIRRKGGVVATKKGWFHDLVAWKQKHTCSKA